MHDAARNAMPLPLHLAIKELNDKHLLGQLVADPMPAMAVLLRTAGQKRLLLVRLDADVCCAIAGGSARRERDVDGHVVGAREGAAVAEGERVALDRFHGPPDAEHGPARTVVVVLELLFSFFSGGEAGEDAVFGVDDLFAGRGEVGVVVADVRACAGGGEVQVDFGGGAHAAVDANDLGEVVVVVGDVNFALSGPLVFLVLGRSEAVDFGVQCCSEYCLFNHHFFASGDVLDQADDFGEIDLAEEFIVTPVRVGVGGRVKFGRVVTGGETMFI